MGIRFNFVQRRVAEATHSQEDGEAETHTDFPCRGRGKELCKLSSLALKEECLHSDDHGDN